jgi:hypothetical protein
MIDVRGKYLVYGDYFIAIPGRTSNVMVSKITHNYDGSVTLNTIRHCGSVQAAEDYVEELLK